MARRALRPSFESSRLRRRGVGVSSLTLWEWSFVLEAYFVVFRLSPDFENFGTRHTKAPKLYFIELELVASLPEIRVVEPASRDLLLGRLLENLVVIWWPLRHSSPGGIWGLTLIFPGCGSRRDLRSISPWRVNAAFILWRSRSLAIAMAVLEKHRDVSALDRDDRARSLDLCRGTQPCVVVSDMARCAESMLQVCYEMVTKCLHKTIFAFGPENVNDKCARRMRTRETSQHHVKQYIYEEIHHTRSDHRCHHS